MNTLIAEDYLTNIDGKFSLPKVFASGDVNEWCKGFEIRCKANNWNDATMALMHPT